MDDSGPKSVASWRVGRTRLILVIIAVIGCVGLGTFNGDVRAATEKTGGITISPAYQEVILLPNQVSSSHEFTLSNNEDVAVSYTLSTVDMGALDDTGGIVFSGLISDYEEKYGLARWLQLKQTDVTLAEHSSQAIAFDIVTDETFGSGGHYGAIVAKQVKASSAENQVQLNPQAATLLLVRKIGGEIYGISFQGKPIPTAFWKLPSSLALNFRNEGNVHLVTRGLVVVKDMFGREVGRGVINSESAIILPEHSRNLVSVLNITKKLLWPGRYSVDVSYRYDGTTEFSKTSYGFMYFNLPLLAGLIFLVVLVVLLVRLMNSRYGFKIQKIIHKLTKQIKNIYHKSILFQKKKSPINQKERVIINQKAPGKKNKSHGKDTTINTPRKYKKINVADKDSDL